MSCSLGLPRRFTFNYLTTHPARGMFYRRVRTPFFIISTRRCLVTQVCPQTRRRRRRKEPKRHSRNKRNKKKVRYETLRNSGSLKPHNGGSNSGRVNKRGQRS